MFKPRTQEEILRDMLADSRAVTSNYEGTFQYDLLASNSIEFAKTEQEIATLYRALFAQTSWGEYLSMLTEQQGVVRKPATYSRGEVTVKGNGRLPTGSVFSTKSGILYVTEQEYFINGENTVPIRAKELGAFGNTKANTINTIPMSIIGMESVKNDKDIKGGYDEETDEELLERYLFKVRNPATSGNKNDYELWAREIAGVGGAKVISLWNGNGTVKIIIVDKNLEQAQAELIKQVQNYIYDKKPIGATVTVVSATPKKIKIKFRLYGSINQEELKGKILAYFKNISFSKSYVSIAKIGKILLECTGVKDYANLTLNDGQDNINLTEEELPYLEGVEVLND